MAQTGHPLDDHPNMPWNRVAWCGAALLLLAPLVAMQFTREVAWDGFDFAAFGAMLLAACSAIELATRHSSDSRYRAGALVAVGTAFLLVWINLAVGIIGTENDPANLMYAGVLAVAGIGAAIARFRPSGVARALTVTAIAQVAVAIVAVSAGWAPTAPLAALTLGFAALWLLAAALFRAAARHLTPRPNV